MPRNPDPTCPCRARESKPVPLVGCCGRWHAGFARGEHAPTAEALMRSRYSAYALAQGRSTGHPSLLAYLIGTWHPSTAPRDFDLGRVNWTGLDVLRCGSTGDAAVVEFIAHCKVDGRAARLHEISRFVREAGCWLYVDGAGTPDRPA